jgi:hypothetical protein
MPFLGKDWRSSGEQWIRTEHGWERIKVLESILDNLNDENSSNSGDESDDSDSDIFSLDDSINNSDNDPNKTPNQYKMLKKLCLSETTPINNTKQPHVLFYGFDLTSQEATTRRNIQRISISEVLNALDMAGAVRDVKRFNYVFRVKFVKLIKFQILKFNFVCCLNSLFS